MISGEKNLYEFGVFRLDASERRLLRNGSPVHLQPKAFETLLVLVANCGHLVRKEELIERVWADSFVEENNLTKNIYALRKALENGDNDYIQTIPRVGYRFNGDVHETSAPDTDIIVERQTDSRLFIKETFQEETSASWPVLGNFRSLVIVIVIGAVIGALGFAFRMTKNPALQAASNAGLSEDFERGRFLWRSRDPQDLHQATMRLERSIAKDPNSALAHSALADAYAFDYANWKKAEAEALTAIWLDPTLGEPHASIGFIRMFWEWKVAESEAELKQAVGLSPEYATAHQWYALNLAAAGRDDAALYEIERATQLEPASLPINADRCQILYLLNKYDDALAQCRKTLEMNAGFLNAHLYLYETYTRMGLYSEAVDEYFEIQRLRGGTIRAQDAADDEKLRQAFAAGGIRQFWRELIVRLMQPQPNNYELAQYYARLDERDQAIYWLNQAYKNRDLKLMLLAADPVFDEYHTNSRISGIFDDVFGAK